MSLTISAISVAIGVGGAYLYGLLKQYLRRRRPKPTPLRHQTTSHSSSETDFSSAESSFDIFAATSDDIAALPNLTIPRLLNAPIREEGERSFELLKYKFPDEVQIVPFRYFFPLNTETYWLLSTSTDITEPIVSGHPQTIYTNYVHPLKMILNNPSIRSFFFEVVHSNTDDPFHMWEKSNYLVTNFKPKTKPSHTTHVVPLYVTVAEEDFPNTYHVKTMLVAHFSQSSRCINSTESKTPDKSKKEKRIVAPVVLVACFRIVQEAGY
ncbi:hypothetical protein BLNAU_12654 [Blattamonas nauphoetae]|uniref:Uncharacterized protein n=1 Tax=Blattamonas nauphoetae TaxID=2049346 RepID=A0ABQ9XP72_9EUKA|nr:hypothetical protein BLNAU_12654 [Blattamonas nauphoetae]